MNLLQRAKTFVAAKATKIALVALPLAALTLIPTAAQASVIAGVSFSTGSCSVTIGTGNCSNTQMATHGGLASANWIGVSSGTVSSTTLDTGAELQINSTGTAFGSFSSTGTLPVSWDFFINSFSSGSGTVNWDILFTVTTNAGSFSVHPNGVDSFSGISEITGSASIPFSAGNVTGYQVLLTAVDSNFDSFTVTVPGGTTLDLNPATATPEPSGLLLAAAGFAGLLWRRKKSQNVA